MTKSEPLLTAHTREAEKFEMKRFIDHINAHSNRAAIESKAATLREAIRKDLRSRALSGEALIGRMIERVWSGYNKTVLIFGDGQYAKFEAEPDYEDSASLMTGALDIGDAKEAGLVDKETAKELADAEFEWLTIREATAGHSKLQQAIDLLGKERVKELVNGIDK